MRDELKNIRKGHTWRNLFMLLWHVATVRYVVAKQLRKHFPDEIWRQKCGTVGKLELYSSIGLLEKSGAGVYVATPKTIKFLQSELTIKKEELLSLKQKQEWREEELRYNPDIITLGSGKGQKDMLYNTDVLLQAMKRRDFFALFYDNFSDEKGRPWLIPDGILLMRRKNRLGLAFLEIENEKPNWENHIEEKKMKYEALAYKEWLWSHWWKNKCEQLKINHCRKEEFGFSVWCIGEIKQENWLGWHFKESIM